MISVRIAGTSDAAEISRMIAASWKTAYRGLVEDDYLDQLPYDHWECFLTRGLKEDSIFAMVLRQGEDIGAAILGASENIGEVHLISLYLMPCFIGRGFGSAFYRDIEQEIIRRGYSKCVLDVLAGNERAQRFYTAHGFALTGKETTAMLGGKSYTCLVMEKELR